MSVIPKGGGGVEKVTIDGVKVKDKLDLVSMIVDVCLATYGSIIVYEIVDFNGEIHVLGRDSHYKWDGTTFVLVSTLPYYFYGGAVVYNNEIHIFGGSGGSTNHYKWDGSSWTSVSTLPQEFSDRCKAKVFNNEIHLLYDTYHYKWNGTAWVNVSTLPYSMYKGSVLLLNNEIHILGGSKSGTEQNHYKWDGSSWTYVSTLPYKFYYGDAEALNGEIHILGGSSNAYATSGYKYHYKWDGENWEKLQDLPIAHREGDSTIIRGMIHIMSQGGLFIIQGTFYGKAA